MKKNKDGLIAGEAVSWVEMVAANARRSAVEEKPKTRREDLIESLEAHGVENPKGSTKELEAQLKAVTEVNL